MAPQTFSIRTPPMGHREPLNRNPGQTIQTHWLAGGVALGALALTMASPPLLAQSMPSQEQMMTVGACMANLDPAAIDAMQSKGDAFQKDLQTFCRAGQRDKAVERARQYGQEMATDPLLKQIKACSAGLSLPIQSEAISPERWNPADICSP